MGHPEDGIKSACFFSICSSILSLLQILSHYPKWAVVKFQIPRSHFIISGPSVQRGAGRALQDRQADGETLQTGKEEEARSFISLQFVRRKKGGDAPFRERKREDAIKA